MRKITLQVNGRKMTFSEKALTAIVEKHLSTKDTKKATTAEVAKKPTEEKWFEVKPQTIDQNLFLFRHNARKDEQQEEIRLLIVDAFKEMEIDPERYGKNFKTMFPKRTRSMSLENVGELKAMASKLGDHNADWVEQSLEWAQRIANGETWESICNDPDTAKWGRLVKWKNGYTRVIGGSHSNDHSAANVGINEYKDCEVIYNVVPLIVSYK